MKNEPLLKLIGQVVQNETWQWSDTSRFARVFSQFIGKEISRNTVQAWLIKDGIPPKYLGFAVQLSQECGGDMTTEEFRPDLYKKGNYEN